MANAYASINRTGLPDLLATSGDATNGYYLDYYYAPSPCLFTRAYLIFHLSASGPAEIDPQRSQKLS